MPLQQDPWNGEYYKKNSDAQFMLGTYILNQLALKGTESVLDIGCGDGRITAECAKKVPQGSVFGIDTSASMIAEAKRSFATVANLSFQQADATYFVCNKTFDIVVSFSTFHWINDKLSALQSIFKAFNPGGQLIIFMQNGEPAGRAKVFESAPWKPYLGKLQQTRFYTTPAAMNTMLATCGFNDISVSANTAPLSHASKEEMFNWAKGFAVAATGLNASLAEAFAHDLAESVCTERDAATGKFIEHCPFLYATAKR